MYIQNFWKVDIGDDVIYSVCACAKGAAMNILISFKYVCVSVYLHCVLLTYYVLFLVFINSFVFHFQMSHSEQKNLKKGKGLNPEVWSRPFLSGAAPASNYLLRAPKNNR
ncbi:hypothetical protein CHUAL_005836 [Chamberlinius hualienensis]